MTHFTVPAVFDQRFRKAEDINREALALLEEREQKGSGKPFFLFLNYMDAHEPYIPPPPFDTLFIGKNKDYTLAHYFRMQKEVMKGERKVTEEEYQYYLSQYDGGIAYIDHLLGTTSGTFVPDRSTLDLVVSFRLLSDRKEDNLGESKKPPI